jgi:hypothetical protein
MATKVLAGASWARRDRLSGRASPEAASAARPRSTRRALELVAMRGGDVIGVRHVLDGARAMLGQGSEALAPVGVDAAGATSFTVGEVNGDEFVVHVPDRARVRSGVPSGLARLGTGPTTLVLAVDQRAVVVLRSGIQIRARIVEVDIRPGSQPKRSPSVRWLVAVGALYVGALALCAVMVPDHRAAMEEGSLQRVVQSVTSQAIALPRGL